MTPLALFLVSLNVVVFLIWSFRCFRILFRLHWRAVARIGRLPGPVEAFYEVRNWLRDPSFAQERRQLLWTTAMMAGFGMLTSFAIAPQS